MNTDVGINRALRGLGFGFIFEVIDFRVMYVDVLPDFVGYILIVMALHQLSACHSTFGRAKWVAIGLIFLTIPHLMMASNVSFSNFGSIPLYLHVYSEALLASHVLLVYWICNGLMALAGQDKHAHLYSTVVVRRNLYLFIAIVQLIFYPFLFNLNERWILSLFVFGGLQMIMELLFIRLPFRFAKENIRVDRDADGG